MEYDSQERVTTRHESSKRDKSRNSDTQQLEGRLKTIEADNLNLKTTNRAKDRWIQMAHEERMRLLDKLTCATRKTDQLETLV